MEESREPEPGPRPTLKGLLSSQQQVGQSRPTPCLGCRPGFCTGLPPTPRKGETACVQHRFLRPAVPPGEAGGLLMQLGTPPLLGVILLPAQWRLHEGVQNTRSCSQRQRCNCFVERGWNPGGNPLPLILSSGSISLREARPLLSKLTPSVLSVHSVLPDDCIVGIRSFTQVSLPQ